MVKDFPLLPFEKILKKAGKEIGVDRVSNSASLELKKVMLEMAEKIAAEAVVMARHAKRVTVRGEDIRLVVKR